MRRVICTALIAVVSLLSAIFVSDTTQAEVQRPNIVVVMLDDMPELAMWVLQDTLVLFTGGTSYTSAIAPHPLCCPVTASFLTGQYDHNNGVATNKGGWQKFKQNGWGNNHLGTWLQSAGYQTAWVGKYLNGHGRTNPLETLPGWNRLGVLTGDQAYKYWDYNINVDGVMEYQRKFKGGTYQTDRLAELSVEFITDMAATGDPFFLVARPLVPHTESGKRFAIPAPEYVGSHDGEQWRPPNYSDAGRLSRPNTEWRAKISAGEAAIIDNAYESILEALESADDMIVDIFSALEAAGELENTVVMLTSDHGYYLGEHGVNMGKIIPYDTAIQVPLYVTGPGFTAGVDDRLTPNVDLTATILDLAGASSTTFLDGVPLRSLFDDRAVPLSGVRNEREYRGVRTDDEAFWNYQKGRLEAEWYDLVADPWQNRNLTTSQGKWRLPVAHQQKLNELKVCAGESCVRTWP